MNNLYKNIGFFIIIAAFFLFLSGCENNLSDEGLSYISGDTLGTLLLDSQKDTMNLTSHNFIKYINTFSSANIMVGKSGDYESKALLRVLSLPSNYDTVNVLSAKLNFRYKKTFYEDSLGAISFNIYKLNKYYDFSTLTYDEFYNEIGTDVLGTYTGTPTTDTVEISIPFDNETVKNWFKYAHDTNYVDKNYGIILVPNSSSNTIKSFYSYQNVSSYYYYIPNLTVVISYSTGVLDTLAFNYTEAVSLNHVPQINSLPGRIVIQNGIAIKDIFKFDFAKIPAKSIINQAVLELQLDSINSFKSSGVDTRMIAYMLTDTAELTNDGVTYYSVEKETGTYSIYLTVAVQKWINGAYTNFGVLLQNIYDYSNLDRYVFYGPDYPDVTKRPKVRIRYTIRN